jgi:cytochrome c oxidase cbb3-type subunit 2
MFNHGTLERHSLLLTVCILLVVSIGGLVEIAPLFYLESTIEKVKGCAPDPASRATATSKDRPW